MMHVMLVATTKGEIDNRKQEEEFSLIFYPNHGGWKDEDPAYVIEVVPAEYELPKGYLLATITEWGDPLQQYITAKTLAERLGLMEYEVKGAVAKEMANIKEMFAPRD